MRTQAVLSWILAAGLLGAEPAMAAEKFRRGDGNSDGKVDISDPIFGLTFLFNAGEPPDCPDAVDANDDGEMDISDPVFTLLFLFADGKAPPDPGPLECGEDPTADDLALCSDPNCAVPPTSCIDLAFSGVFGPIGADPADVSAAAEAASLKLETPETDYLEGRLAADAEGAERIVVLESYHPESAAHSFFYARLRADEDVLDAATNMAVQMGPSGPLVSLPGPIMEESKPVTPEITALLDALDGSGASSGAGANSDTDDGTTYFLSYDKGGTCLQHALYGYNFSYQGPDFSGPTTLIDATRYAQTELAFDLWLEVFGPDDAAPLLGAAGELGAGAEAAAGGIVVIGTPQFKQQVLQALQAIAPCYLMSLVDCHVVLVSPADFVTFCDCYCQHRAGMNLITDLALGENTTTIQSTAGGNEHANGTVSWNPDSMTGGRNADGNTNRPPKIGLAHELTHAKHTHCGTRGAGTDASGIRNEEINTSRGENQLRGECGQPKRTHYGASEIPNNCDTNLDDSNRFDCRCP